MPSTSFTSKIGSVIQSADRYGVPITLNLSQQDKFSTIPGGLVSIVTYIGAIAYFGYCLDRVMNNEYQMT